MGFHPEEILFSPTARCNLHCHHCVTESSNGLLPVKAAEKFLAQCRRLGIEKVGFTGGEPFLAPLFLKKIVRKAVQQGIFFDRIMTNGVWYKNKIGLGRLLNELRSAGYDGSICVSVDAFHDQDLDKLAYFIRSVVSIWNRKEIVSIACVTGSRDTATRKKIMALARRLSARLVGFGGRHPYIKNKSLFVKIDKISLCPVGKASKLSYGWDDRVLVEDFCRGPGNVFFVLPSGEVKPCCGYASDHIELSIGNIKQDSARGLVAKARKNRFVRTLFKSGLNRIRNRLEKSGMKFPGRTGNHCYLCHYILTETDPKILDRCLD